MIPTRVALLVCFVVVATLSTSVLSKRLLIMPYPITSHLHKMHILARAVAAKGHDVWLIVPHCVMKKGFVNISGPGINVLEYNTTGCLQDDFIEDIVTKPSLSSQEIDFAKADQFVRVYQHDILSDESLYIRMHSIHADLFLIDYDLQLTKVFVVLPYKLGLPIVFVGYGFVPIESRTPFTPATTPHFLSGLFSKGLGEEMSLLERAQNTWAYLCEIATNIKAEVGGEDFVRRYAPEKPEITVEKLVVGAELWLLESDHVLYQPYPTMPNVKFIGGLSALPPQPLPEDFRVFMDDAPDGIVVVSFGSLVLDMPEHISSKLMTALLQLRPIKAVIRINVTSPDPRYIMTSSWLPQNALLAHKNCRVLVTHCGLGGQYQGMYHAVPMLGLPQFYDQWTNGAVMETKGFGIVQDLQKASVEDLVGAIKELMQNATYKNNLNRASALFRELYGVPVETAAYWLDHVMKYGGRHFQSVGQRMPLYQFLLLDILALVMSLFVIATVGFSCCVSLLLRCCRSKGKERKSKRE